MNALRTGKKAALGTTTTRIVLVGAIVLAALTLAGVVGAGAANAVHSPDGRTFAFTSNRDGDLALRMMSADATSNISTSPNRAITQRSIGGARLGLSRQAYVRVFGTPRIDLLEGGLTRLVFTRLRLEVYLRRNVGVAINTFGRTFRTRSGVGPCSPFRALTAAYRGQLRKLPTSGPVALYRLGNLVFRVDRPRQRVGAVTLGRGSLARLIAGNSIDCGAK